MNSVATQSASLFAEGAPAVRAVQLDDFKPSAAPSEVRLPSGRYMRISAQGASDELEIRGHGGEIVMRVTVDERGPVFRFQSARVAIDAESDLELRGRRVVMASREDMLVEVGGDHHTRVAGAEHLEAARVEVQANEEHVAIRARENVAIDCELIGLNDEPIPAPFPWSQAAKTEAVP